MFPLPPIGEFAPDPHQREQRLMSPIHSSSSSALAV
jgi:hypothetical protein